MLTGGSLSTKTTKGETEMQTQLAPHQERVVAEKAELDERLAKLKTFIFDDGKVFNTLDPEERNRLENQFTAMTRYSAILGQRIAAF